MRLITLAALFLSVQIAHADVQNSYVRKNETIVTLLQKEDSPGVRINISGIKDEDRSEFIEVLRSSMQKIVAVRANITLNSYSADPGTETRSGLYADNFAITTGMRHRMREDEAKAIFAAADTVLREILADIDVTSEAICSSLLDTRRRKF